MIDFRSSEGRPKVAGFYDARTSSVQYVVADDTAKQCVIIDPVLDYEQKSGATATWNADRLLRYVQEQGYAVDWILDTHPHADHLSSAQYIAQQTGAPRAIGEHIREVQELWTGVYNLGGAVATDGRQWDRLFAHGDTFQVGHIEASVMFSPGHTLASVTYLIGDAAFVHDTLFQPDFGTARADFPGGSAKQLWRSIQDILALPGPTRLFTGHDYPPDGRDPEWQSTVQTQREANPHLQRARTEAEYVELRHARDKMLPTPDLLLHAMQVNIRGGALPDPESNGRRYLRIPLDALEDPVWD